MKLYSAPGPNSYRVRIFMAEKGLELPISEIDFAKREHKSPEFLKLNSLGQVPVLALEDGDVITESVAICRYLESLHPEPPMFGRDGREVALIDMWIRRIEFQLMTPVGMFWRHAHPLTAALLTQFNDFGESNREAYGRACGWLNRELDRGGPFIAGSNLTSVKARILLMLCIMKFGMLPPAKDPLKPTPAETAATGDARPPVLIAFTVQTSCWMACNCCRAVEPPPLTGEPEQIRACMRNGVATVPRMSQRAPTSPPRRLPKEAASISPGVRS